MDFTAITNVFKKKNLVVALLLSLSLSQHAWSAGANDATLEKLEKWLFFATFPSESDEDRIKRLEERTFGEAASGSIDERLKKLDEILTERQKEKEADDQTSKGAAEAGSSASNPSTNFGGSPTTGSQPGSSPPPAKVNDAEAAKERQRVAVQAAREQEMHDLLQEGANLWRTRHGQEAVERFEQVLRLDPQNPDAHFSIGVIKEAQGKLKEALSHYQLAAQSNPENTDYSDAVAAISRRIQTAQNDPNKVLTEKATAAFKRGEYISALNAFKELEAKNPKQASTKYSIGTTYLMMKDHFNALEYFKLAHQLEPNNEKYTKSFNDLSAELAKHQQEQQGIESQYAGQSSSVNAMATPVQSTATIKPSKNKDTKSAALATPNQAALKPPQQYQQASPRQFQAPPQQYQAQQQYLAPQQQYQAPPQQFQSPPQQFQSPQQQFQAPPQQFQAPPQQFQARPQQFQAPPQQFQTPPQQQLSGSFNPYNGPSGFQNSMSQGSQSYIPPDPQQYSYQAARQMPQTQQPIQMPPQMPQQMQQTPPMQSPVQPVQQQMSQPYSGANQSYASMGSQPMGGQEYTPTPQAAPQGAFDPRLAQQLNSGGSGGKTDPMSNYGISAHGTSDGVMINSVRSGSRAARAGLRKGDVIRTVDGNEVMQPSQLNQVLSQYNSSQTLPLLIFRDGNLTPIQF